MKQQLLLIFLSFFSICSFSQETYKIDYDTKMLEGTWVATLSGKSYEITFVKETLSDERLDFPFEMILGSIKYIENNKVVKTVNKNGIKSSIRVFNRSAQKFTIHYTERDNGKKIYGRAYFDINTDGKTARWYNLDEMNAWDSEPKKDKFDIPKELTFKKK